MEAFRPSPSCLHVGQKASAQPQTDLSLNLTSKVLAEDNDLRRQRSAPNSGEMVKTGTFLSANGTESWWVTAPFSNIPAVSEAYITRDE